MKAWVGALAIALAAGCNRGGGGGGGHPVSMTFHGQKMATIGQPLEAKRGDMVVIGRTDDNRQVFMMRGGGGGGGRNPVFIAVGENRYMVIVPTTK